MNPVDLGLEVMTTPKKKTKENKQSKLIQILNSDTKLEEDIKLEYISLAKIFLEDFSNNIYKSSIEMNEIENIGVDTWQDFLAYPPVRKYIQSFKSEQMGSVAEGMLMKGEKEAVNIQKLLDAKGNVINNNNIVVMRLPEKGEF